MLLSSVGSCEAVKEQKHKYHASRLQMQVIQYRYIIAAMESVDRRQQSACKCILQSIKCKSWPAQCANAYSTCVDDERSDKALAAVSRRRVLAWCNCKTPPR